MLLHVQILTLVQPPRHAAPPEQCQSNLTARCALVPVACVAKQRNPGHSSPMHSASHVCAPCRAKRGTAMAHHPEPPLSELLWSCAVARLVLGPRVSVQVCVCHFCVTGVSDVWPLMSVFPHFCVELFYDLCCTCVTAWVARAPCAVAAHGTTPRCSCSCDRR